MERFTHPAMTVQEVAEYLQTNDSTVRRYTKRGLLPASRLPNGRIIIRRQDLEEFLAAHSPVAFPEIAEPAEPAEHDDLAEYIARLVAEAPPLTDEQRARLAAILRPATNKTAS